MNKLLNKMYIDLYQSDNPLKKWLSNKIYILIWERYNK